MALQHLPLNSIGEAELRQLIEDRAAESRNIEYKRQTYGGDFDAPEWLADVSSFANTAGGDIIIGMRAEAGVPIAIEPVTLQPEDHILRLEQIARAGLEPRLVGLAFHVVQVEGGHILVVRVPQSFNPPHRIIRQGKGQHRFWARSSAGKYEPNVDELRALFNFAPDLSSRIRAFREERIARIAAEVTPTRLMGGGCLVLHVLSLPAFAQRQIISLTDADQIVHGIAPMGTRAAADWRVNVDGLLALSHAGSTGHSQRAYVQLFRAGRIEAVSSSMTGGERPAGYARRLTTLRIEAQLVPAVTRYLPTLNGLGVDPPYVVLVSLLGVRGTQIIVGDNNSIFPEDPVDLLDDQMHFGDIIVDSVPRNLQESGRLLRPVLEQLANAAGLVASRSFDAQGEYILKL